MKLISRDSKGLTRDEDCWLGSASFVLELFSNTLWFGFDDQGTAVYMSDDYMRHNVSPILTRRGNNI